MAKKMTDGWTNRFEMMQRLSKNYTYKVFGVLTISKMHFMNEASAEKREENQKSKIERNKKKANNGEPCAVRTARRTHGSSRT